MLNWTICCVGINECCYAFELDVKTELSGGHYDYRWILNSVRFDGVVAGCAEKLYK